MALPPPGVEDRPPGERNPPKDLGRQSLLWLIGGPNSAGDWNEGQRRARRLALRGVLGCVPAVWGVFFIRICAHLPDLFLWWILFGSMAWHGMTWLVRFVGEVPTRVQTRALVATVTAMDLLLVTRLGADERVTWGLIIPAGLVVSSLVARQMATGLALWTTHVFSAATSAERGRARAEWIRGRGTPELATIRRGQVTVGLAYLTALAVTLGFDDGLLPWLAFLAVAFGTWCILCSRGLAPHQVAGVCVRAAVLWGSYNPPLVSGRTLLEPYTYQMPDPWLLLYDRRFALRLAAMALAVGVVAAMGSSAGTILSPNVSPTEAAVFFLGVIILAVVRYALIVTLVPFLLFFTVLFVTYGTALTDYYGRFAASAVAEAERRSPT